MKTVKVNRHDLLEALHQNRKKHKKEFKEIYAVYLEEVEKACKELYSESKLRKKSPRTSINIGAEPQSHITEYDVAIDMVEFSVDEEIELTEEEFRRYFRDEWSWSRTFAMAKTAYSK